MSVCCLLLMYPTCSCGCRWQARGAYRGLHRRRCRSHQSCWRSHFQYPTMFAGLKASHVELSSLFAVYWVSYWQYLKPVHFVLRSNSGFCVYFFRRLNIRCTKCQSSSLTWLFFPGHRRSPIFCGKRSHLIFAGLCILSRPVPGHRHFQDFGWRNCFSRRACLAVQSEHTIFAFLLDSIYFRRASYGNFRCPRSPHSSQRYGLMSLGDTPLLWHSLHTSMRLCFRACSRMFASNAPSASIFWQALHVHCCLLLRHCIHTEECS